MRPGDPGQILVDTGSVSAFDAAAFSRIEIRSGAGNDEIRIDVDGKAITVESGAGADVITGGRGREVIAAGDDGDLVLACGGDDTLLLGGGNDTAIQRAGDGSDVLEGQSGADTLQVSGSSESEEFTVQAVGARARITRDLGGGADVAGIELAEIRAGGGADLVDIGELSGTGLTRVDPDLGLLDGAPDTVFAQGTAVKDTVLVSELGDIARVTGLPGEVRVDSANPAQDRLIVQARGGDDDVRALGNAGALIALTLEGNEGADTITGGNAAETLRGGPDTDVLQGKQGADVVEGGDGLDTAVWSPATDGDDLVNGDCGVDRPRIPTRLSDDAYEVAADGARVRVSGPARASADVEVVDIGLGTGADRVDVRKLAGTSITGVALDMGAADQKVDLVTIDGTTGSDNVKARASTPLGVPFHEISGAPGEGVRRRRGTGRQA